MTGLVTMEPHLPQLGTPLGVEHACPRAHSTILRLSFCSVKENLAFDCVGNLPQRARPRGPMRHGAGCTAVRIKKIAAFRFEANALPFWASFPSPNGISMHAQDGKSGPFSTDPKVIS